MLMMSQMTVFWRRAEYGMLDEGHFNISDEELIERVQQIMVQHPDIGQSFFLWTTEINGIPSDVSAGQYPLVIPSMLH